MTRRSSTTLTISIQLRIPAGSNAKQVLGFIHDALSEHKTRVNQQAPISAIALNSAVLRVTKRETVYL